MASPHCGGNEGVRTGEIETGPHLGDQSTPGRARYFTAASRVEGSWFGVHRQDRVCPRLIHSAVTSPIPPLITAGVKPATSSLIKAWKK